ncbi:hypothetical protein HPB47_013554 [Ixodes persulcatus]|uniref:Uncharacterized protein n=1 Tax=Ixodes persulcatus TaxID=34615 RepID=A0AC60QYF7_IXOPE|nr:hypothetical protein HPB47_013554 [Ixodes persulcatus]
MAAGSDTDGLPIRDPADYNRDQALGATKLVAALIRLVQAPVPGPRPVERIRIHPFNHTFTLSTPDSERARSYCQVFSIMIDKQAFQVTAYLAMPENTTKVMVPGILTDETPEDVIRYCMEDNPELPIIHARRMGKTSTILVTLKGTKAPRENTFRCVVLPCYPYKEKLEACVNCRKVGHRADVGTATKQTLCRKCGRNLQHQDASHACTPSCIVCGGPHDTGSKDCQHRFVPKPKNSQPKAAPQDTKQGGTQGGRTRSSSRGASESRMRDHSVSSPPPPLPPPPPPPLEKRRSRSRTKKTTPESQHSNAS